MWRRSLQRCSRRLPWRRELRLPRASWSRQAGVGPGRVEAELSWVLRSAGGSSDSTHLSLSFRKCSTAQHVCRALPSLSLQVQLVRSGSSASASAAERSTFRLTASLGTLQVRLNYEGARCATLSQVSTARTACTAQARVLAELPGYGLRHAVACENSIHRAAQHTSRAA